MKNIMQCFLAGMLLVSSTPSMAASVYPTDLSVLPSPATVHDLLTADVTGFFATPGYVLDSIALDFGTGNNVIVSFSIMAPTGIVPQVLEPFSYTVDMGYHLGAGQYSILADFYVDNVLDASISNNFTISSVPLPAAAWLFMSGILAIFTLRRKVRLT